MNFRLVVISAACLAIFVEPASSISLHAAAAAVKGAVIGAGLGALKSAGGSETVIIQSEPGSIAEVVPASQVVVQNPVTIQNGQIISYKPSNPISRLWSTITGTIAAKVKAIGDIFQPNRVVIVVPPTTTTTTTEKPVITIDVEHKPLLPLLPSIGIDVEHKPLLPLLPSIGIDVEHKPLLPLLPSIGIDVEHKPLLPLLPSFGIDVENKPLLPLLPSIDIDVGHKPYQLPTVGIEVSNKPSSRIEFSAALNKRRFVRPVTTFNYLKK